MQSKKPLVLTFADYYLPGYKGGGCIRGVANVVYHLGDEFQFKIITRDRDSQDTISYPNVNIGCWNTVGKAEVMYIIPNIFSVNFILKIIQKEKPNVLYLNSFFSPFFTASVLLLRQLKLIPKIPIILAPRGEFSKNALALKRTKKQVYLGLFKFIKAKENFLMQASSNNELSDIKANFKENPLIFIAGDLPNPINPTLGSCNTKRKKPGILNILFLSRISPMKNLDGLIEILFQKLEGKINLSIYGHIDDLMYWNQCELLIKQLPKNIKVQYYDAVAHHNVENVMMSHDLFFLPTLGENFGYVILEALLAGCPVLISDNTVWRNLEERGAGWDISLDQPQRFQDVIQKCIDMDEAAYQKLSNQARQYGIKWVNNYSAIEDNRTLFKKAVSLKVNSE